MSKKQFRIPGDQIKRLIQEVAACYASDKILVDGQPVGYMYRERRERDDGHSGWSFFAGTEDQAYADDPAHFGIYEVNTVANYDPAIIPYLGSEFGRAYERIPGTANFQEVAFEAPEE